MTKPRIILVEDEAITAQDIRTSLEELGYEVPAVATRGAEAVRMAAEVKPDLILMDIVLDGPMSGIEAAEAIRRAHAIPIVFLTAHADVETVENARATEPFGYLLKPCALDTMRSTIEVALYKGEADARHRKEEEKKAKHEAKNQQIRKAESLARMAGAIAHHFNNLLGAVMGNVEMAMDLMPQGTPTAPLADSLTDALQAARKAAKLSSLMLTYLGQSFSELKPLALAEVCRSSLPMLLAALPGNVTLKTDLPSFGPLIRANENHIQQVLVNLITNAWEAIGAGRGDIRLSVKTVSPMDIQVGHCFPPDWQPQDNTYACLEVADSGCGIAVKNIEEIFDPFFSDKFTGRGLGLPVVLGIVRAHDGAITVESQVGQGSVFRVFLPALAQQVPTQADQAAETREKAWSGAVLLVEDNELVRNMALKMLVSLGFTVLSAKDGVEALEVFLQHKDEIRCVLSDVTMPRMDGWETLAAMRKIDPDLPVILASGYDEAQVMAGDHPERPQAFLSKPYLKKELYDAISQALGNSKD